MRHSKSLKTFFQKSKKVAWEYKSDHTDHHRIGERAQTKNFQHLSIPIYLGCLCFNFWISKKFRKKKHNTVIEVFPGMLLITCIPCCDTAIKSWVMRQSDRTPNSAKNRFDPKF